MGAEARVGEEARAGARARTGAGAKGLRSAADTEARVRDFRNTVSTGTSAEARAKFRGFGNWARVWSEFRSQMTRSGGKCRGRVHNTSQGQSLGIRGSITEPSGCQPF